MTRPIATLTGVRKVFAAPNGVVDALGPLDLQVGAEELVCVIGPSGCGKSTLLRLLTGLTEPTSGTIGRGGTRRDGQQRSAMVFQDHGLFPWMDVRDNIAFGLEAAGVGRDERRAAATALAGRIGLGDFLAAFPHQLSGGMRQRVGIARALLVDPDLLLLDEPFSALDAQTRIVMQEELVAAWEQSPRATVFVTHDMTEALRLADRIIVLSDRPGRVVADLPVQVPRPRGRGTALGPDLEALRIELWDLLEQHAQAGARGPLER